MPGLLVQSHRFSLVAFSQGFLPNSPRFFEPKKKRLKKQHQRQQLLVFPAVASCGPTQRRIPRFQPNHFRSFEIAGALSASPEGRTQRLVGNFIDSSLFKKSRSKVVLLNKKRRYSTTASAYWKYLNICNLCIYCYVRSTSFNLLVKWKPTCSSHWSSLKRRLLFASHIYIQILQTSAITDILKLL